MSRRLIAAALALALAGATVTGCATTPTSAESSISVEQVAEVSTAEVADGLLQTHLQDDELTWDDADVQDLTLAGSSVTISEPGTYRLTGTIGDGQIVVDSTANGLVRLILDGVDVSSTTGPALLVENAAEVMVVLADGSQNSLSDSATYAEDSDVPNAALYSTADLTITGDGSLTVNGGGNDGITSKDGLVIVGGSIDVTAADDGIRGKDYLVVRGGTLDVTAVGDGLTSDDDAAGAGYVSIEGGTVTVDAATDGIEAESDLLVSGGEVSVTAGDDALHAESDLVVSAGTVTVVDAFEGLEAAGIAITGGTVDLTTTAQDADAINVAGGVDGSGTTTAGGSTSDDSAATTGALVISGGEVTVVTGGDGIDVNGSLAMSGGTVVVDGPASGANGSFDIDGTFVVTGGTLLGVGAAGMLDAPDTDSAQASIVTTIDQQAAGSTVRIVAADGSVLAEMTPSQAYGAVVYSGSDVTAGEQYTVEVDGTEITSATAGEYSVGGMGGMGGPGGAAPGAGAPPAMP